MEILTILNKIQLLLDSHMEAFPLHKESCLFLKDKFNEFEFAISSGEDLSLYIHWCKWFAPRIIFDGIGDKELLEELNHLNICINRNSS